MKKSNMLATCVLLLGLYLMTGCSAPIVDPSVGKAVKGHLDLAGHNLETDAIASLAGEWEFYWNHFYFPEDFTERNIEAPGYMMVPGSWNGFQSSGAPVGGCGHATYRLVVSLDSGNRTLTVRIPEIASAYSLYVNGRLLASAGRVAADARSMKPEKEPEIKTFYTKDPIIEFVLHVSNFQENNGGIWYRAPLLGSPDMITGEFARGIIFQVFLFGCIIIIAFYHLSMFVLRKKELSSLYFFAFCIVICVRLLVSGDVYLIDLLSEPDWELVVRLDYLTFFIGVPLFLLFFSSVFNDDYSRRVLYVVCGVGCVFALFAIFGPLDFLADVLYVYEALTYLNIMYTLYVLVHAIRRRREGASIILAGTFVLILAVINDFLHHDHVITTLFLAPAGLFAFIIAQSFMISHKYAVALEKSETYAGELEEYSRTLELKVAERTKQLRQTMEQKTSLFDRLAHETRTPLTLINNYLGRFMKKHGKSAEAIVIRENIKKLAIRMNDFLDLEKAEKGMILFVHERIIDCSAAIASKIELYRKAAEAKGIEFKSSIEEGVRLRLDPEACDRIANNLFDNALKFTDAGGTISITLKTDAGKAIFSVEDTGAGMSRGQIDGLFKPARGAAVTDCKVRGSGIGLALVHQIVQELRGNIGVMSEPGKGSRFTITLRMHGPEARGDRSPRVRDGDSDEYGSTVKRPVMLIVEDDDDMVRLLESSFRERYDVYRAASGQEALSKIATIPRPDLIVSDIVMDGLDGHELLLAISRMKRYADIPFVFLTAKGTMDERLRGYREGAIDFITKPFEIDEFVSRVDSLVRNVGKIRRSDRMRVAKKIHESVKRSVEEKSALVFRRNCERYGLSGRELEIVTLLFDGHINKEICAHLGIAYNTVRNHIRNIYRKCDVRTKVELINRLTIG